MNVARWVAEELGVSPDEVTLDSFDMGTATYVSAVYTVGEAATRVKVRASSPTRTRTHWLLTARVGRPRPTRSRLTSPRPTREEPASDNPFTLGDVAAGELLARMIAGEGVSARKVAPVPSDPVEMVYDTALASVDIDDPNLLAFEADEGDYPHDLPKHYDVRRTLRQMTGPVDNVGEPAAEPRRLAELESRIQHLRAREKRSLDEAFHGWGPAYFRARDAGHERRHHAYAHARSLGRNLDIPDNALHVIHNAAGALVVRDLISPDDFGRLFAPWASVMEVDWKAAAFESVAGSASATLSGPVRNSVQPKRGTADDALRHIRWRVQWWREVHFEPYSSHEDDLESLLDVVGEVDQAHGHTPRFFAIVRAQAVDRHDVAQWIVEGAGPPSEFLSLATSLLYGPRDWLGVTRSFVERVEFVALNYDVLAGLDGDASPSDHRVRARALAVLGRWHYFVDGDYERALRLWKMAQDSPVIDAVLYDMAEIVRNNERRWPDVIEGLCDLIASPSEREECLKLTAG